MEEIKKSRSVGIDLIKAIAVFFVICVHFSLQTNYYNTPVTDKNMMVQSYLRWIFLIAVPTFVTCTGYLNYKKTFSRQYYLKILRVIIPYVLISIACLIVKSRNPETPFHFKEALFSIFNFSADAYSWYVNMYIGLFIMAPLFNIVINSLDRKKTAILIAMLVFVISLPATFNPIINEIPKISYVFFPNWWQGFYPVLYYFIGAYIAKYQVRVKKWICLLVITIMPGLETLLQMHMNKYKFDNWRLTDYSSLFIVIECIGVFLLLFSSNIKNRIITKPAKIISNLTLEIYLFSCITDSYVYPYFKEHYFGPSLSQEEIFRHYFFIIVPLTFVLSLVMSIVFNFVYSLCRKGIFALAVRVKHKS